MGLSRDQGPAAGGGDPIVITGTGFTDVTSVKFGDTSAGFIVTASPAQIAAVVPAGAVGTVCVKVTTSAGTSAETGANAYVYQ